MAAARSYLGSMIAHGEGAFATRRAMASRRHCSERTPRRRSCYAAPTNREGRGFSSFQRLFCVSAMNFRGSAAHSRVSG
jgi:hypothetical protein